MASMPIWSPVTRGIPEFHGVPAPEEVAGPHDDADLDAEGLDVLISPAMAESTLVDAAVSPHRRGPRRKASGGCGGTAVRSRNPRFSCYMPIW